MTSDTTSLMPMTQAARLPIASAPQPPTPLPLPPMPGGPPASSGPLPLPSMAPQGGPLPLPASAPIPQVQKPPYAVELQDDGTSVYTISGPNGKPVIIGLNKPPKLPAALQPPKGA